MNLSSTKAPSMVDPDPEGKLIQIAQKPYKTTIYYYISNNNPMTKDKCNILKAQKLIARKQSINDLNAGLRRKTNNKQNSQALTSRKLPY